MLWPLTYNYLVLEGFKKFRNYRWNVFHTPTNLVLVGLKKFRNHHWNVFQAPESSKLPHCESSEIF